MLLPVAVRPCTGQPFLFFSFGFYSSFLLLLLHWSITCRLMICSVSIDYYFDYIKMNIEYARKSSKETTVQLLKPTSYLLQGKGNNSDVGHPKSRAAKLNASIWSERIATQTFIIMARYSTPTWHMLIGQARSLLDFGRMRRTRPDLPR